MNDAFSDYLLPLQLSEAGFRQMMRQRGLDRAASRIALEGEQIAALWLVSLRGERSYLIASGTRPQFRSRGLARALADDCLAQLKAANVQSFQTEVMDGNEVAAALYFKLGMTVSRQLDCYDIPLVDTQNTSLTDVSATRWQEISSRVTDLRSWLPSWQNSDQSLQVMRDQVVCAHSLDDKGLAGYAAALPDSMVLAQIAVRPDCRRRGLGSRLIALLQQTLPKHELRVINAQADDTVFARFMASLGAVRTVGQRELHMLLSEAD